MRFDSDGIFWVDQPEDKVRGTYLRPQPPIPETGWVTPKDFPRLDSAPYIALDTETWDPELLEHGPGWARGIGHIVGVSVAVEDAAWYFPVRHTILPEQNMLPEAVFGWLRDTLANPNQPKIGANLMYDVGWLSEEKVPVVGPLWDVQFAEALLDESSEVALEVLAQRYLGLGKETELVYQWCADYYGGAVGGRQRANLYRAPPSLVGPYAEADSRLPLRILAAQWPLLEREGLLDLFTMENGLIPLLIAMRRAGVSVSIPKAEETAARLTDKIVLEEKRLKDLIGFEVNTNAAESISQAFDQVGIKYGKTATGKPSFTKDFLAGIEHPLAETILEIRKCTKLRDTFIQSYIIDSAVNGKVYGQFHPLRGDSSGTRSGRLSSSTPNLQNLPARDEELAPLIRGIFIPDPGHENWVQVDYSQIEYRFLVHYALGAGSDKAREQYVRDPDTDYHEWALDMVAPIAGWDISQKEERKRRRKPIKNINFGLVYGMGVPKLTRSLGLSAKEGKDLFAAYHHGVPFVRPTMDAAMAEAQNTGTITTILNRKSRFNLWEPKGWGTDSIALPYEKAILTYGNIQRAYTHKGLNRKLQGSAADLIKMAMWKCWKDGIFDRTGVPRLTVHDELDFSNSGGHNEDFREMQHVLETAIPLKVPVKANPSVGPDWGHAKELKSW
jgi:DNA polymerase I-like protein with 3'-5' exonuclease and polymerase domains